MTNVRYMCGRKLSGSEPELQVSPITPTPVRDIRWLRSAMHYRDINVVCPTDTVRRRLVERGVPIDRCHLLRPGVSFAKAKRRRNETLRAELGISPGDRITLAPGESTRQAN